MKVKAYEISEHINGLLGFNCLKEREIEVIAKALAKEHLTHNQEGKMTQGDILDRHSIDLLKLEYISEYKYDYVEEKLTRVAYSDILLDAFKIVNRSIWQLESELKSFKEELPVKTHLFHESNKEKLAQVGIVAIMVRNLNSVRIALKNLTNLLNNCDQIEVKHDHASGA